MELTKAEEKYRKAYKKLNSIAKKNSKCRKKRKIVSCNGCDLLNVCQCNGYNEQHDKVKRRGQFVSSRKKLLIHQSLKK